MTKCLIQIPENLVDQRYQLRIQGTGAMAFENTTQLSYETKSHSIFIQTDKAIYKPGQTSTYSYFPSLFPFVVPVFFIKKYRTPTFFIILFVHFFIVFILFFPHFVHFFIFFLSFIHVFIHSFLSSYSFNRPSIISSFIHSVCFLSILVHFRAFAVTPDLKVLTQPMDVGLYVSIVQYARFNKKNGCILIKGHTVRYVVVVVVVIFNI